MDMVRMVAIANCLLLLTIFKPLSGSGSKQDILMITNQSHIFKHNLKSGIQSELVQHQKYIYSLDFNYANGVLFWSDWTQDKILAINVTTYKRNNERKAMVVVENTKSRGIALDWVHNNLYWTDSESKQIMVKNLERDMHTVLIEYDFASPCAIEVDPRDGQGFMYWTVNMGDLGIEKAGLDGSGRRYLITTDNRLMCLALDLIRNQIYWIDTKLNIIETADIEGSNRHQVGKIGASSYTFDILGNNMYWTQYDLDLVYKANKCCLNNKTVVLDSVLRPLVVSVFDDQKQPFSINRCGDDNGGCPHLCLPSPGLSDYVCVCADNVPTLDRSTCNTTVNRTRSSGVQQQQSSDTAGQHKEYLLNETRGTEKSEEAYSRVASHYNIRFQVVVVVLINTLYST